MHLPIKTIGETLHYIYFGDKAVLSCRS